MPKNSISMISNVTKLKLLIFYHFWTFLERQRNRPMLIYYVRSSYLKYKVLKKSPVELQQVLPDTIKIYFQYVITKPLKIIKFKDSKSLK